MVPTSIEKKEKITVGIDDMALYVPKLFMDIALLAEERDIEYDKLNKGLGLRRMAFPDVHEDAATMAANAVVQLIDRNELDPRSIGRLYLGTESALDGAKPTATYILEMLRHRYRSRYGSDCLRNCDAIDMTFACVGGVDALHNTLDWVRGDKDRIGIVVTSDFAKYELGSTGEYTQGAGAVAMLVKQNPRLLAVEDNWGVATKGVHDFFKPKVKISKKQIVEEVLLLMGDAPFDAQAILNKLPDSLEVNGFLDQNEDYYAINRDMPVFDGPYSNQCYQDRIREAYLHWRESANLRDQELIKDRWNKLIFHLPYAAHGRRIFSELFVLELEMGGLLNQFLEEYELSMPSVNDFEEEELFNKAYAKFLRGVTKTAAYQKVVKDKIASSALASSQVGNMYACSIFLALMSMLESDLDSDGLEAGNRIGFFAYGSGSKSKVFEAVLQPNWREVAGGFGIFNQLTRRTSIRYDVYERLHRGKQTTSVQEPRGEFALQLIGNEGVKLGARYYQWAEEPVSV